MTLSALFSTHVNEGGKYECVRESSTVKSVSPGMAEQSAMV